MTDALVNLDPILGAVSGVAGVLGGPLVAILAAYLGFFVVGLVLEAVRSRRNGSPDV